MRTQAVLLLTHFDDERIITNLGRLRDQAGSFAEIYLCKNQIARPFCSILENSSGLLTEHDANVSMPVRTEQMIRRGSGLIPGYCDLAYIPAAISAELAAYEYVWLLEYDVDFAGDWGTFFSAMEESRADLLTTTIYPKASCPGWPHWSWLEIPDEARADSLNRCFAPISRYSRRFLFAYTQELNRRNWNGHFEALFPAIASTIGCTVEDIGGTGPFVPPARFGKYYENSPGLDGGLTSGTMIFRPAQHRYYFSEDPTSFKKADFLYHPIKANCENNP